MMFMGCVGLTQRSASITECYVAICHLSISACKLLLTTFTIDTLCSIQYIVQLLECYRVLCVSPKPPPLSVIIRVGA